MICERENDMEESKHIKKAKELRESMQGYNCAETVLMAFVDEIGLTEEQARRVGTNFGGGMKSGSVCGAVTGAIAVLGMLGITDPKDVGGLQRKVKENHNGMIDCMDLLKANHEAGGEKKAHCDAMVYEAIKLIEEIKNGD